MLPVAAETNLQNLVSAGVVALIIMFLTLPAVFLLVEYAKDKDPSKPKRIKKNVPVPEAARPRGAPKQVRVKTPWNHLTIEPSEDVYHGFLRERVPREVGLLRTDVIVREPFEYKQHLRIGDRCILEGDLLVEGSLVLGAGSVLEGSVTTLGNLYVENGAIIRGTARVHGNMYLHELGRARDVTCDRNVELEYRSSVEGNCQALGVRMVPSIDQGKFSA